MPSISNPRHVPGLTTYEATILGLVDTIRGSLLSAVDAMTPSQEKKTALRDGIELGALSLSCISTLLSELRSKVQILQDGYDKLQSSINLATNTLMSPIFCLPDEIMVEIMLFCSPFNGLTNITTHTRAWFPSVLVMVSRKWRDLAYSAPRLWSSFHVAIDGYSDSNDVPVLRMVDRHLRHSAGSTLSLSLSLPSSPAHQDVLRQILTHSERWEHLTLSQGNPFRTLNEECSHRLPKLRSLALSLSYAMTSQPITAFDDAPELRSLTIEDSRPSLLSPHFPWNQLTHLTFYRFDPRFVLSLLSQFRSLINLSLYTYAEGPGWSLWRDTNYNSLVRNMGNRTFVLPRLRHLFVAPPALPIFNHIVTPALEQLYIQGGTLCGPAVNLIGRSGCALTELTIDANSESHAIESLLAACDSLVVLTIQAECRCIDAVYVALNDPAFLPHLRSLTLMYCGSEIWTSPFLIAHRPTSHKAPFQDWVPSHSVSYTPSFSQMISLPLPSAESHAPGTFRFDDQSHVTALATAIRSHLTTLQSVLISNPITEGIAFTLLSFASQGVQGNITMGGLPQRSTQIEMDAKHRSTLQYGTITLEY